MKYNRIGDYLSILKWGVRYLLFGPNKSVPIAAHLEGIPESEFYQLNDSICRTAQQAEEIWYGMHGGGIPLDDSLVESIREHERNSKTFRGRVVNMVKTLDSLF